MQSLYERQMEAILGGLGVAPPGKLTVMRGETVRMTVAFNYRGSAISVTLYGSIGQIRLGVFDEIAVGQKTISLPSATTWISRTEYVDIVTTPISPGTNYDIYAKIKEYPGQALVEIADVIDVIGAPEFQDFRITDYSKAS